MDQTYYFSALNPSDNMEVKKNPEVYLENKKSFYFLVGLMFSLGVVLIAFEWSKPEQEAGKLGQLDLQLEEEEMIPITQQTPPPPPPFAPRTALYLVPRPRPVGAAAGGGPLTGCAHRFASKPEYLSPLQGTERGSAV